MIQTTLFSAVNYLKDFIENPELAGNYTKIWQ